MGKVTNEKGYSFEIEEILTKYVRSEQPQWGGNALPALDDKYVVLEMTKGDEFIGYILFDTIEQHAMTEPIARMDFYTRIDAAKLYKLHND